MADRFGTKRLYMTSIALFVIGSSLSGLAWSSTSIIVFRVLEGLGGGMIVPTGMTILTRAAGPERIGRVMSVIMGVPMLLGPILGPILGGWLVTDVSWRWIFFINVPIGFIALVPALRVLPRDVPAHEQRLDFVDLPFLSPGLALFIYGLAELQSIRGPAVARASTALNILQQTGASIGTAVLSVLLASAISSNLGSGHGTIGATRGIPPSVREHIAPRMAAAFGQTFLVVPRRHERLAAAIGLFRFSPDGAR